MKMPEAEWLTEHFKATECLVRGILSTLTITVLNAGARESFLSERL